MPITSDLDYAFRLARDGELLVVSDEEALRQALIIMFSTDKGERVMHPTWGADLTRFLQELVNEDTAMAIDVALTEAVQGDGRFQISNIKVIPEPDNKRYIVTAYYQHRTVRGSVELAIYSEA